MNKTSHSKAKRPTQATHPETQRQPAKTGTPGSESSKAQSGAKDTRNAHDKDGNGAQRAR